MDTILTYLVFFGGWLLFAGPVYQAAHELREQDLERDRIHAISERVAMDRHVSPWWWLLPPVKLVLEARQSRQWRYEYFKALSAADRDALVSFTSKARGWMIVALGALFISIDGSFGLGEVLEWSTWFTVGVIVICIYFSLAYTVFQLRRDDHILEIK